MAVDDGKGQGEADLKEAALPRFGIDLHLSTQRLDILFDHVHAHPTARNIGDGLGR